MLMRACFRPSLLSDHGEANKPTLQHVLVERIEGSRGRLVAANGFYMGIFPVELSEDDVPGMVRADLLPYAASHSEWSGRHDDYVCTCELREGRIEMPDGSTHPRQIEGVDPWPDWRVITTKTREAREELGTIASIAMDPRLVRRAQFALGNPRYIALHFRKPTSGFVVTDGDDSGRFSWEDLEDSPVAFVIVMPCRRPEDAGDQS